MQDNYALFLQTVPGGSVSYVQEINDLLLAHNCKCEVKPSARAYTVSYIRGDTKKVLANFVIRKTGVKMRIYAEHVGQYSEFLNTLPETMMKEIKKASVCKRLLNPENCNSKCSMGYQFIMDGEEYKLCRYSAFMPTVNEENLPYILGFLQKEIA